MTPSEAALSQLLKDNGYRVLRGGWPDYFVVPGDGSPGFAVELKSGRDQVRPHQQEMHDALETAGIKVLVAKAGGAERLPPRQEETRALVVPPEDALAVLRNPAVDAYIQEMTSLGGRTRAANLTPKARQKIARSGGKAVWAGISPEERSRRMKAAIQARWSPEGRAKAKMRAGRAKKPKP